MAKAKKYFNNPNGELTISELIQIKHFGKQDEWIRKFKTITHKCPPKDMKISQCFYCVECWNFAFDLVKEYKGYYKVGKEKYYKDELKEVVNEQ